MLFAELDEHERTELAGRLRRAGERLGDEANMLAGCPPAVLAAYRLPRDGYHDFYSAAIECSMLSVEVWQRPAYRGVTCSHPHNLPYNDECNVWWLRGTPEWRLAHTNLPEPARNVPTGTGWPL